MTLLAQTLPVRQGQLPNNLPVTSDEPDYLAFLRNADLAVEAHESRVRRSIANHTVGPGLWHPNGFATFEIAEVPSLGLLRLHVWPRDLRRSLPGHPEVHNHSFQLFSRVIAGVYRETQYRVDESGTPLHRYEVDLTGIRALDSLIDTGRTTSVVKVVSGVAFEAGSWHEVEVGKFHATPISPRSFCATLAVISPRVQGSTDVLLGRPGFTTLRNERPVISELEMDLIYDQLDAAFADRTGVGGENDLE